MIHLVVPGLSGAFPRFEQAEALRYPALERLLARADRCPGPDTYPAALFQLFGIAGDCTGSDYPTAAVCYHADSGGVKESRYLLHADPIHLRPDQDRLLAFDFHTDPLGRDEANAFVEAFNRHFGEDGLELLAPEASRWYLAVESAPDVRFHALAEAIGRNVDLFMPEGGEATRWAARLNEIQMLFHSLPMNQEREQRGRLPVSGLWFGGGGYLPAHPTIGYRTDGDDCCLLQGLAALAPEDQQRRLTVLHRPGRAVLDGDTVGWQQAVASLDLKVGDLMREELRLHTCDGVTWHWKPGMRYRFWAKPRPIRSHWSARG